MVLSCRNDPTEGSLQKHLLVGLVNHSESSFGVFV